MRTPKYLKPGDKIGIVAPARKVTAAEIEIALRKFKEWGLEPVLGNNLFGEYNQFSGTDAERAADFQSMLDDENIKAIICARGGYGSVKIIEQLNFSKFSKAPKWVVGFSDITVFHSFLHRSLGVESLHATMPFNFPKNGEDNDSIISLKAALFGEKIRYEFESNKYNKPGKTTGVITGGNLSILYSLRGSSADIDTRGKILFIEDLDEYLYHIDRMIMNLKNGGKLDELKALVVGGMTEMKDNQIPFGKNAIEIIREAVDEYDYPVCFDFPAGHQEKNNALILGREVHVSIEEGGSKIIFSGV